MTSSNTIIQLGLITALAGYAFQRMMDVKDKMIFAWYFLLLSKFRKRNKFCYYLSKPLGMCITCNTAWIGFMIGAFFTTEWNWRAPIVILIIGLVGAGIANLLENLYNLIQNYEK